MTFLKFNRSRIKTYINVDQITRIETFPLENEGRIHIFTRDGRSYTVKVEKGKEDSIAELLIASFSKVISVDREGSQ